MCSKKSRHLLKSKMGSIAATYPKIKRVPLFSETFRYFALRYWTKIANLASLLETFVFEYPGYGNNCSAA